jgi:uridine phosphorylase
MMLKDDEPLYHTGLSKAMIDRARIALVPGDPGRSERLAKAVNPEKARFVASHRDFTTWLTYVNSVPVAIMSTGMGGSCVSFAVEELARLGIRSFIRVGTTGAIQKDIPLGSVIINKASVRMDGASKTYAPVEYPAVADLHLTNVLMESAKELGIPYHEGISVSTDTFWTGQERYDSYGGYVLRRLQHSREEFQALGCTNYEMENASLFTICSVLGLKAASICGVVAQRLESERIAPPEVYRKAESSFEKIVKRALEKLTKTSNADQ